LSIFDKNMPTHDSDDEFDDQELVMSDYSDDEASADELMSDDEGGEEEDETDYTYNELMAVVSRATVFLREKYAKEGEDGLPDTRDELVTIIEPHCTVKRAVSLNLAFAFLATTGILTVRSRESSDGPVESLPTNEEDPYGPIIEAVVQRQVIAFAPHWKSLCNNPNTFDKLREIPKLDQQLVLEHLLSQLNEEDEKSNMKLSTREILNHLVNLAKQKHKISAEEVVDYYLTNQLLSITKEQSSDEKRVLYQVEYDERLLKESKKTGMNFWMLLILIVIISPPLLKKILGLTFS